MEPPNPGGAGGLVEVVAPAAAGESSLRRDYWLSEPDTTNNRMALRSAIAALELIDSEDLRGPLRFVSDSQYLVTGMKEWVPDWRARGWRRKGGSIMNLELWQRLVSLAEGRRIEWKWIEGHAGHAENEYANYLAIRAAQEQSSSAGLVRSGFEEWMMKRR
jgi:ribonuclease HI